MYKNRIQFNCQKYIDISPVYPANCYNCALRNGYPRNLGGDKQCKNFKMYERKKPDSIKILKREVWDLFSEWVRRSEADSEGICKCVTCGKYVPWTDGDTGHYIHGTLFLIPELCHFQCKQCNGFKHGNLVAYKDYMIKKYGLAKVQYFEFIAKRPHKYTVFELQNFKKMYQAKLAELR